MLLFGCWSVSQSFNAQPNQTSEISFFLTGGSTCFVILFSRLIHGNPYTDGLGEVLWVNWHRPHYCVTALYPWFWIPDRRAVYIQYQLLNLKKNKQHLARLPPFYRVTNVSYTGVSYTAKLQRFVYKLCNVSYTLRVCIPCVLNIWKCINV